MVGGRRGKRLDLAGCADICRTEVVETLNAVLFGEDWGRGLEDI